MNEVDEDIPNRGSGCGKYLIVGAIMAAVVGAGIAFVSIVRNEARKAASLAAAAAARPRDMKRVMIELPSASLTAPRTVGAVHSSLKEITEELLTKLDGIQDSESAEQALPTLQKIGTKIDAIGPELKTLSSNDRSQVDEWLQARLEKLNLVIDRIIAMPEMGTTTQALLEKVRQKLNSYTD